MTVQDFHCNAKYIVIVLLLAWMPSGVSAQDNKLKLNNELYSLYAEASKKQASEEGLQLAHQMYERASALGDKRAMCLAVSVEMLHYYGQDDDKKFFSSVERLKKEARNSNYSNYYYFAYQYQILRLSNAGKTQSALDVAQNMTQDAIKEKDHYGISLSYKAIADIYFGRTDYTNAKAYYKKGIDYINENDPTRDATVYYAMMAMIARKQNNYEESLYYSEEGLKRAMNKRNIAMMELSKAYSLQLLGRNDEFLALLKTLDTKVDLLGIAQKDTYYILKVQECIMRKDYTEAFHWADKSHYDMNRKEQHMEIYKAMGEWKSAYELFSELETVKKERQSEIQSKDLAEANAKFDNEKLRSENLQLALTNANSRLSEANALARQKATEAQRAQLEAYNKELNLQNSDLLLTQYKTKKQTELDRKQAELERQKIQAEKDRTKHRATLALLVSGIVFLAAIILLLIRNRRDARRFIEKLTKKNEELIVARDLAQQSEKMKVIFVQNMSHEIRTPLNAIIGFTDMLLTPDIEISNEERKEFQDIIHHNSELLTSLVNDILTISELQSSAAAPTISECHCNEICRKAIGIVKHRLSNNIELIFNTELPDDYTIMSDQRRINQVLINFLTNAEKYTTKGSITLDCSIRKHDGYVTFTVTDTGSGIPKEKRHLVFERFQKLDNFKQGMGLGLNICSIIAKLLDAKIGIDEDYDDGARFYFAVKDNSSEVLAH